MARRDVTHNVEGMIRSLTIVAIMCGLVACGGAEVEPASSSVPVTPSTTPTTASSPTTPPTAPTSTGANSGDASQSIIRSATIDLASRLGVDEDQISLISFEEVTWSDGSLGCPEPGMAYTQAVVEGSETVLEVDGIDYAYHAGGGQEPFLCEDAVVEGGRLTTTVPGYDY